MINMRIINGCRSSFLKSLNLLGCVLFFQLLLKINETWIPPVFVSCFCLIEKLDK